MTVAVKTTSIEEKLKELQERLAKKPLAQIDENGAVHIVLTPAENKAPETPNLKETLQIVRNNFEQYSKKNIHHPIKPEVVQRLSTYLDLALKDFENNVNRFMPNIKNTDYKLEISVNERNQTSVRIGFKNPQGKQIGPFLSTHITSSPHDMLAVDIGYMDKNKHPVYTHSFDYDSLKDVDNIMEQRGDKSYMKTRSQMSHDKFADVTMKKLSSRLRRKRERIEF